jgi:hypothetical protein
VVWRSSSSPADARQKLETITCLVVVGRGTDPVPLFPFLKDPDIFRPHQFRSESTTQSPHDTFPRSLTPKPRNGGAALLSIPSRTGVSLVSWDWAALPQKSAATASSLETLTLRRVGLRAGFLLGEERTRSEHCPPIKRRRCRANQGAWASRPHRSTPVGATPTLLEAAPPQKTDGSAIHPYPRFSIGADAPFRHSTDLRPRHAAPFPMILFSMILSIRKRPKNGAAPPQKTDGSAIHPYPRFSIGADAPFRHSSDLRWM